MFSAAKRFFKHIVFLVCSISFVIVFTDKDVLQVLRNPWVYYGSFFLILCMLLILVYIVGLPSFDELKEHLGHKIMNEDDAEYDAEYNENGEEVEEQ